jgi:hypothetical protein
LLRAGRVRSINWWLDGRSAQANVGQDLKAIIPGRRQMRTIRLTRWLVVPAGIVLGGLVAGSLVAGSLAAANAAVSQQARQACTPDAMRLCSQFIPNAEKVKVCMLHKRSQLSAACRLAMRGGARSSARHHERRTVRRHHVYHHYSRRSRSRSRGPYEHY